jgi:hypothetical protein
VAKTLAKVVFLALQQAKPGSFQKRASWWDKPLQGLISHILELLFLLGKG